MTFINTSRPINTAIRHAVLLIYLLFLSSVKAQQGTQGTPDPYPYAKFSPSMAIIIAVLVTALFFMGFFSIYIRRCSQSNGGSIRPTLSIRRRAAASRGLDAEVIETFPTLAYSEVKDLHVGKGALECAVCLNEFEDDEMLRLLPKCDHVFHPECIDMWLANHSTCPVCRADLVPKPGEAVEPPGVLPESVTGPDSGTNIIEEHPQDEFHVTITQDEDRAVDSNNMQGPKAETMKRIGSLRNRPPRSGSVRAKIFGFGNKFTRSHSTGHSLVQLGENLDRFTLRLPEEVRKEVIRRALLNRNGSSIARGEGSLKRGLRTGEGSSRGRNYRRLGSLERVVNSDRWVFSRMPSFLTRALSTRSPKVVAGAGAGAGEASTSSASAKAGGDWYGRSDEGHEASLSANDSAKLPV